MVRKEWKAFGPLTKFEINRVKEILENSGILSVYFQDYRSFALHFKAKVVRRKEAPKEEVIEEWQKRGLRRDILEKIASFLEV